MNKMIISFLLMTFSTAHAGEKSACYQVEGMSCAACSLTIKTAVKKLDGISSVTVDSKTGSANVTFDGLRTTSVKIAEIITRAGYNATEKGCGN